MNGSFDYNEVFMGVLSDEKNDYRLKRLTEALRLDGGTLLDIGCGGGILTESLSYYYPKTKIYGCDISKTAINYAKRFGSGKVFYNTIISKKLPYEDNLFNACICLDAMEHIPDVNFFLEEVKRVLKKNGKFFLLVPCEDQAFTFTWFFQKIKFGNKLTFKNWGHIHPEFTHKSVIALLEKHGFSIKRKTYSEHFLYQIVNIFTYFLAKEIMSLVLGKNADKYLDRGIVKKEIEKNREDDIIDQIRKLWLTLGKVIENITNIEIELFKNTSITAWKIHILADVNK